MFCLHRALFFAIALLACIVIAAPVVEVEPQQVLRIVHSNGSGVVGHVVEPAAPVVDEIRQTSVGARVLFTARKFFSRMTKGSAGPSNQPTHFRRRVRVVRRRHP